MSVLFPLLIGIAVNLDNFVIGMNLGVRGQKLTIFPNFVIGMTTGVCAFASTMAAKLISGKFMVYTNFIGAVIMIFFGYYCLIKDSIPKAAPEDDNIQLDNITLKETVFLGFMLAVNCVPPSISAGAMNQSALYIAASSALFSFVSMYLSNRLGCRMLKFSFTRLLSPASSLMLIALGIFSLIT